MFADTVPKMAVAPPCIMAVPSHAPRSQPVRWLKDLECRSSFQAREASANGESETAVSTMKPTRFDRNSQTNTPLWRFLQSPAAPDRAHTAGDAIPKA